MIINNATLSISDLIQLVGILISSIASITAIIISIKTLKQNNKMIEESTRPVISVYAQNINPGIPSLYLVVRNFGTSPAYMKKFDADFDFTDCYMYKTERNYIEDFSKCVIAPNQARICLVDYSKLPSNITLTVEYQSASRTYSEIINVDLKAAVSMPSSKFATKDKELLSISYSLQELLLKNL